MTSITYDRLSKKPVTFLRLTGTKIEDFKKIVKKVKPIWEEKIESRKKCPGRRSPLLVFENKLLVLLIYYRTYATHEFIGYLFGLHNSNICRLLKKLEPIVAMKITIKKDRTLTPDEILKLIADVTEQPIQRPKKKQRKFYSGKKKRHTLKTEIVMKGDGEILGISRVYKGRVHDFRIRKEGRPFPRGSKKFVDSGYQGLQKITDNVVLPFKRKRKQPLTKEQKRHNTQLASFRVRIENKIRSLKIFRILKDVYRNFHKKHNLRFNIIAGIVNLKSGF